MEFLGNFLRHGYPSPGQGEDDDLRTAPIEG
jgi:hypothetical protein